MEHTSSASAIPQDPPDSRRGPYLQAAIRAPENSDHSQPAPQAATHSLHSSLIHSLSRWIRQNISHRENSLKAAIEEVLEAREYEETLASGEERALLRNLLRFGELTVSDVMLPRMDIMAIAINSSLSQLKKLLLEERHTRIPVYGDTLDEIHGFIHLKDLVPYLGNEDQDFDMGKLVREILFVPSSMRIVDLLMKMRLSGCHMAIVIDEYGGTDGLVTMEDLFEEIVGEIQDEHDEEDDIQLIEWKSDTTLEADARAPIDMLENELSMQLATEEDEDFDTVGGMIYSMLGRIPARGEVLDHPGGIKIEILSADPRRVRKVQLKRLEDA